MNYTFVRFIIVGIANTVVGLSVMYLLLHAAGLSYWMSTFLGNSVGACVSFFLNRSFTFKSDLSIPKSMIRFAAVILLCYFVSYYIGRNAVEMALINNHFFSASVRTDIAVLLSTGLYTMLNYFFQKVFVFQNDNRKVTQI
jgi:putative flippase GtrA